MSTTAANGALARALEGLETLDAARADIRTLLALQLWHAREPTRRTTVRYRQEVSSGVTIELDTDPVPAGFCWIVERVGYGCTSSTQTLATMYLDAVGPENIVDFTDLGNRSLADQFQPIYVPGGARLVVVWENVTLVAGAAAGTIRMQYRVEPLYLNLRGLIVDDDLLPAVRS